MIDRPVFEELVKETAANLYDYAALEAHPLLFTVIRPPEGFTGSKSDYIRRLFEDAILYFRPPGKEPSLTSPDWRPYLILQKRYIEGITLQELALNLAISERQLRRDHRRALSALAARLWEQLFPDQEAEESDAAGDAEFEVQRETIDLREVLSGVEKVMQGRVAETGVPLLVEIPADSLLVEADRVILRQVLVSTCSAALHTSTGAVQVRTEELRGRVDVLFAFDLTDEDLSLEMVRDWVERMGGQMSIETLTARQTCVRLSLPEAVKRVILVIDDQAPAINMFQRYLSRTPFKVVGVTRADQAIGAARSHHPALILLDVMMPQVDGWELLQSFKLDEDLRDVPVIVCSAWEEPDMARSLGALRFLKKPVTQKALLDALDEAGLGKKTH